MFVFLDRRSHFQLFYAT